MKINNVSTKTSKRIIVIVLFFCVIVTTMSLCNYFNTAQVDYSIANYINWYISEFNATKEFMEEDVWIAWFTYIAIPLTLYGLLVILLWERHVALKEFNSQLNLKSVEFLQGRINFNFNKPLCNVTCNYSDIEELKMVIHTIQVRTKNGSFPTVSEIELQFSIFNDRKFILKNIPNNIMNFIYSVIDYSRGMQKFSYCFKGYAEIENIKEKIEDYQHKGFKQILSNSQENYFKFLSFACFVIALVVLFQFQDGFENIINSDIWFIVLFVPICFGIISFILDFILIADRFKEILYKNHPANKINWGPVFIIKIIITLIMFCFLFHPQIFSYNDNKILKIKNTSTFQKLKINPRSEYNFLTKKEIYDIRKSHVRDSIFARNNYQPSEQQFGSIIDGKPWWGDIKCQQLNYNGDYKEYIQGKSWQSLKINNPNMLVSLNNYVIPWYTETNHEFCTSEYTNFVPHSLKYNKNNNLFVVEYKIPRTFLNMRVKIAGITKRFPLQLSGLNALDFGYKYVYAFNTQNIQMYDKKNNITKHVGKFSDYIHLGSSCKYAGGCNNISPVQFDKIITLTDLPAEINLKLWKKAPKNKYFQSDVYYRIIFSAE